VPEVGEGLWLPRVHALTRIHIFKPDPHRPPGRGSRRACRRAGSRGAVAVGRYESQLALGLSNVHLTRSDPFRYYSISLLPKYHRPDSLHPL